MREANIYSKNARECRQIASAAPAGDYRRRLLVLARMWGELAAFNFATGSVSPGGAVPGRADERQKTWISHSGS